MVFQKMSTLTSVSMLEAEHIASFLAMEEVHAAKQQIDARTSGSVYFTVGMTDAIKAVLKDTFDLDLLDAKSVPMRWIKGDITPHVDVGTAAFDTTHLLYLTDSPGELVVDGTSYPIMKGAAYTFPESSRHETINTGSEPRLLLGPMSEEGFAVGGPTTIAGDASNVYIRQIEGSYEYSFDQINWLLFNTPTTVINTDTGAGILTVEFVSDLEFTSITDYFICGSSHIQFGSASLNNDGSRPVITIDGVSGYPGLIQNTTSDTDVGYNYITICNLVVNSVNGSTLIDDGGWVGQEYFGGGATGNRVVNCSSDGPISEDGGGIIGIYAGSQTGASLVFIGCSSSGDISDNAGGIVGRYAGESDGSIRCESCWSTGSIISEGGGITGEDTRNATIINCYSTGAIGDYGGGICGQDCRDSTITNCYSTGTIGSNAGGILGEGADRVTITNCYSLGNMTTSSSGGISGPPDESLTIEHCYTAGTVTDDLGYIIGNSNEIPLTCFSEAFTYTPGGTWNSTHANTVLEGLPTPVVGTTWVATVTNEPYELFNMGYTPYTAENVIIVEGDMILNRGVSETITAGASTNAGLVPGRSYTILQIADGNSGSITINSTTGVISTSGSTAPGTYTIYLRNTGSYNITEYILSFIGNSDLSCCDRPTFALGPNTGYAEYTELRAGNIMMESLPRTKLSYDQLMTIRKAQCSKK
jgi:hypothetical protein